MPRPAKPHRDTDRRLRQYFQNGWAPVPWAHHPPHVVAAIRAARMRPKMKGCFENSLRIILQQFEVPFTYCEGWVTTASVPFPMEHAWLKDADGNIVDVTLGEDWHVTILAHREYTREEVREAVLRTEVYGPLNQSWFFESHTAVWEKIHGNTQAMFDRMNAAISVTATPEEGKNP